jgi:hypothetical protein
MICGSYPRSICTSEFAPLVSKLVPQISQHSKLQFRVSALLSFSTKRCYKKSRLNWQSRVTSATDFYYLEPRFPAIMAFGAANSSRKRRYDRFNLHPGPGKAVRVQLMRHLCVPYVASRYIAQEGLILAPVAEMQSTVGVPAITQLVCFFTIVSSERYM